MNRVFRVLWNKAAESWVVVSELMTTRKKSGQRSICTVTALMALGASTWVSATDVSSLNFNPVDCDNTVCSFEVTGGASDTLTGSLATINKGKGDIEAKVNNSNIILYGSNGGIIVNDGVLSGFNSGTSLSAISALVKVDTGGHFENNGLMNVGFLTNGNEIDTSTPVDMFTARGVLVGANSSVNNTGIINVGSANQARQNLPNQLIRGITLNATGSKGTNSGTINVAVNADGFSPLTTGVELTGKSSFGVAPEFTNNADGEIYIGRTAQYLSGAGGKDIPLIGGIGVMASGASKINNAGMIAIGAETQGAVGIKLTAGATGTNTTTGVINVNSAVLGLQNLAVQAGDGSKFTHTEGGCERSRSYGNRYGYTGNSCVHCCDLYCRFGKHE